LDQADRREQGDRSASLALVQAPRFDGARRRRLARSPGPERRGERNARHAAGARARTARRALARARRAAENGARRRLAARRRGLLASGDRAFHGPQHELFEIATLARARRAQARAARRADSRGNRAMSLRLEDRLKELAGLPALAPPDTL